MYLLDSTASRSIDPFVIDEEASLHCDLTLEQGCVEVLSPSLNHGVV